jgi:transposase
MFPRVVKHQKNNNTYEYLVISQSIRKNGKSTTDNIANLGNIKQFKRHDIVNVIDGLIRIFELDEYVLGKDIEILESLTYGPVLMWQKLWQRMNLSRLITDQLARHHRDVSIAVEKYVELMVVNRCIKPLSKQGITRWFSTTCYKELQEFSGLPQEVNYFYRSMDHLVAMKDALEVAIYNRLRNLFSVDVKLTFYDITSTFFYGDDCPLAEHGYSRDKRPDCKQVVVGVVTSHEGYPLKHYVFDGSTTDGVTVAAVVQDLKCDYHIGETIFVGDRGMITQLNLDTVTDQGYDYIMGVKLRQDALCQMLFERNDLDWDQAADDKKKKLKLLERRVSVKAFLLWKTKQVLAAHDLFLVDAAWPPFVDQVMSLTDTDKPAAKEFRSVLQALSPEMDTKVRAKIWTIIKRYTGRYESVHRFICCLNPERRVSARSYREKKIDKLSKGLADLFTKVADPKQSEKLDFEKGIDKIFGGYHAKFKKFFKINRVTGYQQNAETIAADKKYDGVFVLTASRSDLTPDTVVTSYKNLREVETLFDDFKNFVDIRPIRHRLENRVRGHVFICILALLLKRILEMDCLKTKSITEALEEIDKVKLVRYKVKFSQKEERHEIIPKVTNVNPMQKKYFKEVGINNPMNIEKFMW